MDAGRHEADGPPDGDGFDVEHADQPDANEGEAPSSGRDREHREHGDHPGHRERSGDRKRARKHRRVKTEPVPGSDPNPQPEPLRHSGDENDERLKADKPPHWG